MIFDGDKCGDESSLLGRGELVANEIYEQRHDCCRWWYWW